MTRAWDGAPPPDLPPLRPVARLRLALRGGWAAACLALCFAVFLVCAALDRLAAALGARTALGPGVVRLWARLALRTLGLRLVVRGAPPIAHGALVANHASWIDVLALQAAAAPFLVSKAEVRDWPGVGLIGRAIGTMFVDRRPVEAKRQEAELRARLARGDRMALFPEGTSTDGRRVLPFKSSLFATFEGPEAPKGALVQPVTIRYVAPPGLPAQLYAWWGDMDFGGHLISTLARSVGGRVELTFHAPLVPAAQSGRKALAAAAEAAVRRGFDASA
jgi:1-acyl-sn-glycerol-3-phosphate acyltransferase